MSFFKNNVLTMLTYLIVFLTSAGLVFGQQNSEDIENALERAKCGYLNNACCEEPKEIDVRIPSLPFPFPLNKVVDLLLLPVNAMLDLVVEPAVNKIAEVTVEKLFNTDFGTEKFKCFSGKPVTNGNVCSCVDDRSVNLGRLCLPIKSSDERRRCNDCVEGGKGAWTGLGCFYSDAPTFVQQNIFGTLIGVAGIVALLCIIYSSFVLQTSRGNPERIKKAREYLTNCILGLLLIIFSIFLLRLIGVNILRIPGFG